MLCECVLFRFFVPSQDRVTVYILYYLPADFGISETGPVAIRDSSSSKEFACMTRQQRVKFWKLPVPWGAGVTLDPCSAPVRLVSWALIRRGARGQCLPLQRGSATWRAVRKLAELAPFRPRMNGTSVQINVIFCIRAATEEYLNVIHAGSTLQVTSHCPDRTALLPLGCQFLHHRKGQGFTITCHLHGKLGRHKISA